MKLISALLLIFLTFMGCQKETAKISDQNVAQDLESYETAGRENASEFSLPATDGKQLKLSDYKGKIVILDFWATWCGPCRRGIPDLIELQKQYKNDLVVIGISIDSQTKNDVVPFVKEYKINYPVVYGNEAVVKSYGNINSIPTTFIIDREGKIVNQFVGLQPKTVFEEGIKELL